MANEQRPYSNYSSSRKQDKAMLEIGKLQPQDTDLEEAVLGALMLEKDAYVVVCDILKPEQCSVLSICLPLPSSYV